MVLPVNRALVAVLRCRGFGATAAPSAGRGYEPDVAPAGRHSDGPLTCGDQPRRQRCFAGGDGGLAPLQLALPMRERAHPLRERGHLRLGPVDERHDLVDPRHERRDASTSTGLVNAWSLPLARAAVAMAKAWLIVTAA